MVPKKWGAFQRMPCLLWYLSACWKAAISHPLRWRMPNSSCQGSINISFVFIVHYARTVTCVGLFFSPCFLLLFKFLFIYFWGVFQCVWSRGCSVVTPRVSTLCSTEKMKAGLHAAFFLFCFLSLCAGYYICLQYRFSYCF